MKAGKVEPTLKSFKDGKVATPPPKPPAQGAQFVAPAGSPPPSQHRPRAGEMGGRAPGGEEGGRGASNVGGRGR